MTLKWLACIAACRVPDAQTGEIPKEFWCFRSKKIVVPRVIGVRETSAERRLRWIFFIAIALFLIGVLALAFMNFPRRG
jgi:hypothetical protein